MSITSTPPEIPHGLQLRHAIAAPESADILSFSWSPDGTMFAFANNHTVELRDVESGEIVNKTTTRSNRIRYISWSPRGGEVAILADDQLILWDFVHDSQQWEKLVTTSSSRMAWSPDGRHLAISTLSFGILLHEMPHGHFKKYLHVGRELYGLVWISNETLVSLGDDRRIDFWMARKGKSYQSIYDAPHVSVDFAWSVKNQLLAASRTDGTIAIWSLGSGKPLSIMILEGHTRRANKISFSADSMLLASKSSDGTVRIWDCATWTQCAKLKELSPASPPHPVLEFHPHERLLATLGNRGGELRIWDVNPNGWEGGFETGELSSNIETTQTIGKISVSHTRRQYVHYANAKVVLVGDASVGKSGLGLVLSGQPFAPTLSTHGRNVWLFESSQVQLDANRTETRETLLWDLAGQPGYRLIHQLHLNEIAVALVVFDAQSDTDPLAGVRHWCRALRQAQRIQGSGSPPLKKFLVAARIDRSNISISPARIDALVQSLGFDGFFKTSAKEGWQIPELVGAVREAIDWATVPRVSSTELFERIKSFLVAEKEAGRLLSSKDDLYRSFLKSDSTPEETPDLWAQFETCIGRVESRGLIRRLSFGGLVLLQPELLDAYASSLVNAAKDEPDGLGSIAEEVARAGNFLMSQDERVRDPAQEKLLLIAMVEDLLHHEIALREHAEGGPYLTFPSQLTREMPDIQELKGKAGVFRFEGPVLNIYATLVVRLSHSNWFQKQELWRNAATFTTRFGGIYGIALRELEEGRGELTIFYDVTTSPESRLHFEEYILTHLRRRALPDTLSRRNILACLSCGVLISDEQATGRLNRGHMSIQCNVCEALVPLQNLIKQVPTDIPSLIQEMDKGADERREAEKAITSFEGKVALQDFDVFFSYNRSDKKAVLAIAERLKEKGILPWVDEWECPPGTAWQKALEKHLKKIKAAAVFVGKKGVGPWQDAEIQALLQRLMKRKCTLVPVLLPETPKQPKLPLFLESLHWVDFRLEEPDPLRQLVWGITGERSE